MNRIEVEVLKPQAALERSPKRGDGSKPMKT